MNHNKKKINWFLLIICVALPLAVGGLSALLTRNSMEDFAMLKQPPLAPPGWLFPVVPDSGHSLLVLPKEKGGRSASNALPALGVLRRIPEPGHLSVELTHKIKAPDTAMSLS